MSQMFAGHSCSPPTEWMHSQMWHLWWGRTQDLKCCWRQVLSGRMSQQGCVGQRPESQGCRLCSGASTEDELRQHFSSAGAQPVFPSPLCCCHGGRIGSRELSQAPSEEGSVNERRDNHGEQLRTACWRAARAGQKYLERPHSLQNLLQLFITLNGFVQTILPHHNSIHPVKKRKIIQIQHKLPQTIKAAPNLTLLSPSWAFAIPIPKISMVHPNTACPPLYSSFLCCKILVCL